MDDLTRVLPTAIRGALKASPTLRELCATPDGSDVQVYYIAAPSQAKPPYVLILHDFGGMTNQTQRGEFDAWVTVVGVSYASQTASEISQAIHAELANRIIAYPAPWSCYNPVTYVMPFADKKVEQGTDIWRMGGRFRLRGNKLRSE